MIKTGFAEHRIIRRLLITMIFCFMMGLLPLCAYGAEYTDTQGITWDYSVMPAGTIYPYPGTICINGCNKIPENGVLEIPASINGTVVTGIYDLAFRGSEAICEVVLPNGIKCIRNSAFFGCSNLAKVSLPLSLESIGQNAFNGCGIEALMFPEGMECIVESGAFRQNTSLNTVTINGTVRFEPSAGDVFDGCAKGNLNGFEAFIVNGNNEYYKSVDGVLFSMDMKRLEAYPPNRYGDTYTVPSGVETICTYAFSQNYLKTVELPDSLKEIENRAFLNGFVMTEIEIPAGVTSLGSYSFYSCNNLGSVTLHKGLDTIGSYAFCDCTGIYELELPEGLTTIGDHAFCVAVVMEKIYIPDSVTTIGADAFYQSPNVTIYTTNDIAKAYAEDNGISCENATVQEYRQVETGQTHEQNPSGQGDPDPSGGNQLKDQSITCADKFTKTIGEEFYLNASAKTPLKYRTSDSDVAEVNREGLVLITGYGTCEITITAEKSDKYKAAEKTVTVIGRLAKPQLKAVNLKKRKVKLSWSKVPGATGYKLYIKYPGSKKYVLALTKSAKVKSVTHKNLPKNKSYSYKLRAYKKIGKRTVYSEYSKIVKVRIRK